MNRTLVRYALGLIMLLTLAACGAAEQPVAQTVATPVVTTPASAPAQSAGAPKIGATDTVLTIRSQGSGLCPYGPCWSEQRISPDGSYSIVDGAGVQKEGKLDEAQAAELTQLIAAADFEEIRSHPFTGTCPIAFDGPELIYTFQTLSGAETLASCTVAIDESSPLFQHIAGLVEAINQ